MIEAGKLFPGLGRVAGFASRSPAVYYALHPVSELAAVRILVTRSAGHLREVVKLNRFDTCSCRSGSFVTFLTSNGQMRPGEYKTGPLVPLQAEGRGLVALERVALLAAVQIRYRCELRLVLISVAIEAAVKLNFVERLF